MNRRFYFSIAILLFCSLIIPPWASGETLATPHFLIIYPSDASLAKEIAETMEEARETLTEELGVSHEDLLKIKLVPHLTSGGEARYLPDRRIIEVLTDQAMADKSGGNRPPLRFIKGVLWHEYIHFLQHQSMRRFIKDRKALWFIEGTAEYLGTQRFIGRYPAEAVWEEGKTVLSRRRLPTLEDLNHYHTTNQYPLTTYFFSSDAVAFLVDKWGTDPLQQITQEIGEGKELTACLSESLGIDFESFEREWHKDVEGRYKSYIRDS